MAVPTPEQRRAADPRASAWVSASAGSGKTRLLIDRVLRLMLAGTDPARILCLTFTRAAAAEMATRLARRLGAWATASEEALARDLAELTGEAASSEAMRRARSLFAAVLDLPGGMKIETIHAFAQGLLRRFPIEAEVPPRFALIEEAEAAALLASAREAALVQAPLTEAGRGAVARLAALASPDRLGEAIRSLLPARGRPGLAPVGNHPEAVAAAQRRVLGLGLDENAETILRDACRPDPARETELVRLAAVWIETGGDSHEQRGRAVREWLGRDAADRMAAWPRWRSVFLTDKGEPRAERTVAPPKVRQRWPEAYHAFLAEAERIRAVEERLAAAELAEASAALAALAAPALAGFAEAKAARAGLDYDDLIARTRHLLESDGAAAWVHYKLDQGVDHVLIDEAQDTNPDQWAIVGRLTEEFFAGEGARPLPRTVFAVGDEKQSIYGFQGAEPAEFARWKTVFADRCRAAGLAWRAESLTLSFRSVPAVLALVDAVFAGEAGQGLTAEEGPIRHRAAREHAAGSVELWPVVTGAREDPPEDAWQAVREAVTERDPARALAEAIAGRIRTWLDEGELLAARGRPIRPGDVMILVRRRDRFVAELVRALKSRAVPVSGLDRLKLTASLAVQDLLALCRVALLLEADELSLAEVLRGPFCDVSEESLFELCRHPADVARPRPGRLWDMLRARRGERPEWEEAAALIEAVAARADFLRPGELLGYILAGHPFPHPEGGGSVSGRWRLRRRLGADAIEPVEELLNQAFAYERVEPPSLQGFLAWLERAGIEVKREQEHGSDAVRVMTVHAAKGLEAPIVILPDTTGLPKLDEAVVWAEDTVPDNPPVPLWAPRKELRERVIEERRAALARRQDAEHRRLLYVALTRAEDRLIVCGWAEKDDTAAKPGCWYRLVEAGFARLAAEGRAHRFAFDAAAFGVAEGSAWSGEGWLMESGTPVARAAAPEPAEPRPMPLPPWAKTPAPAEGPALRPIRPSREDGEEQPAAPPVQPHDRAGRRFRRGSLIHALLQHLPEIPDHDRERAARRFLRGLPAEEADEITRETLAVLRHPDFAPLFALGSLAEVPVVGRLGERLVNGVVDRLAVTPDRVLVADFKTSRPPPERVADVTPLYLRQMAAYRSVLASLFPGREIDCALVWTFGPKLMPIPAEVLERFAP